MIFKEQEYYNHIKKIRLYVTKLKNKKKNYYLDFFSVYSHKKLMYFRFLIKKKYYNYSAGQLLKKKISLIKFFKKSINNINYTISCLNRKFRNPIKSIFLFYLKNINFKNYTWTKKFFSTNKPTVGYVVITHSWNYINKKKRRIKRKIYKNLLK